MSNPFLTDLPSIIEVTGRSAPATRSATRVTMSGSGIGRCRAGISSVDGA
jgi:hypothetical protein